MFEGGKRSTLQWNSNHNLIHTFFCLYWLVWLIHLHAPLPNRNNIRLIQSFITRGWRQCQPLYSKNSVKAIFKWQLFPKTFERNIFSQRPLPGYTHIFFKLAAKLFTGVVHFATGLTEVSFLHHGVWKRWNITWSEVQFLGNTAVVKVNFLAAVTTKLQLLESGQTLNAAGGSAGADLISCCFGGTKGPPWAGFEPSCFSCSKWTSSTCAVTSRLCGPWWSPSPPWLHYALLLLQAIRPCCFIAPDSHCLRLSLEVVLGVLHLACHGFMHALWQRG